MLRVALVDDEPLGRERIRALLGEEKDVSLVGEYSTGEEALAGVLESAPHLLFLDIQMPGMDGFGLVQLLEAHLAPEQRPFIVVVTAHDAYALRAFDVSAVDYLLKPFDRARFRAAMARARVRVSERPRPEVRFVVRSASKMQLVRAADVEWIAGDGNYARLHSGGASASRSGDAQVRRGAARSAQVRPRSSLRDRERGLRRDVRAPRTRTVRAHDEGWLADHFEPHAQRQAPRRFSSPADSF